MVSLIFSQTLRNVKKSLARTRMQLIFYCFMALAIFMMVLFGFYAVFLWLATYFSAVDAALMVFGFWLLAFLVSLLSVQMIAQKKKEENLLPDSKEQQQLLAKSALAFLPIVLKRKKLLFAAPLFAVAAYFLSHKTESSSGESKVKKRGKRDYCCHTAKKD